MRRLFATNRQAGLSLVEVAVALGMVGLVGAGFASMQGNSFRALSHYEIEGQKEDLRNQFRRVFTKEACAKTIAAASAGHCPATTSMTTVSTSRIAIFDASNNLYVGRNGAPTRIGDFQVRAHCSRITTSGARLFWLDARYVDAAGNPRKDPLTKKLGDWENLFESAPLTCSTPRVVLGQDRLREVVNWVYKGPTYSYSNFLISPNFTLQGRPADTTSTRRKICEYIGMRHASAVPTAWTSCGDNSNHWWDDANRTWVEEDGCWKSDSTRGEYFGNLECVL